MMKYRKIDEMHRRFGILPDKQCEDCSNLIKGRYRSVYLRKCTVYGTDCPIVPVPDHGRLIDADAQIDWLYDDEPSPWKAPFRLCTADRSDVKFLLKNAPTIIPEDPAKEET